MGNGVIGNIFGSDPKVIGSNPIFLTIFYKY